MVLASVGSQELDMVIAKVGDVSISALDDGMWKATQGDCSAMHEDVGEAIAHCLALCFVVCLIRCTGGE